MLCRSPLVQKAVLSLVALLLYKSRATSRHLAAANAQRPVEIRLPKRILILEQKHLSKFMACLEGGGILEGANALEEV